MMDVALKIHRAVSRISRNSSTAFVMSHWLKSPLIRKYGFSYFDKLSRIQISVKKFFSCSFSLFFHAVSLFFTLFLYMSECL